MSWSSLLPSKGLGDLLTYQALNTTVNDLSNPDGVWNEKIQIFTQNLKLKKIFGVSDIGTTLWAEILRNPIANDAITSSVNTLDKITKSENEQIKIGNQQIISESDLSNYFVNNPQPILGNHTKGVDFSNEIFTWGYTSTSKPNIKNIQDNFVYIAEITPKNLLNTSDINLTLTFLTQSLKTGSTTFNVAVYEQFLDDRGNPDKSLVVNLKSIVIDSTSPAGTFNQFVYRFNLGDKGFERKGSFTNLNFENDDPISFINNSQFDADDKKYFISLSNSDVEPDGTGVIITTVDLLTPGGGLNYLCEFYNYSNGTNPNLVSMIGCWGFTDNT